MRTINSDTASLLAGDFRAVVTHALAFTKHLENHRADMAPAIRQRLLDASLSLLDALRDAQCEQCEVELATVQHDARALCEPCHQLFGSCDLCHEDVLIADAVLVDGPDTVSIYHPACAPQVQDA